MPRACAAASAPAIWSADVHDVAQRQRALLQALPQRLALDELRDDEGPAVELAEVVDDHDVRVVQTRRGPRFLVEAAQPIAVGGELRRQELERHGPIELGVVREIDLAHPAGAEP